MFNIAEVLEVKENQQFTIAGGTRARYKVLYNTILRFDVVSQSWLRSPIQLNAIANANIEPVSDVATFDDVNDLKAIKRIWPNAHYIYKDRQDDICIKNVDDQFIAYIHNSKAVPFLKMGNNTYEIDKLIRQAGETNA